MSDHTQTSPVPYVRVLRSLGVCALTAATFGGCTPDFELDLFGEPGPRSSPPPTFTLDRVSGDTLPYVVGQHVASGRTGPDTTITLEVAAGSIVLRASGSYLLRIAGRLTRHAGGSDSISFDTDFVGGQYTLEGNELSLGPFPRSPIRVHGHAFLIDPDGRKVSNAVMLTIYRESSPFADTLHLRFGR